MFRLCRLIFACILIQQLLFLGIETHNDYCCKGKDSTEKNPQSEKYKELIKECDNGDIGISFNIYYYYCYILSSH